MKYIPKITDKQVKENYKHFKQRISIYKKKGLDFEASRRFILEKALPLKDKILEIGTGKGHMTLTLAKAGYKIATIDNDKDVLNVAACNLSHEDVLSKVEFFLMDACHLSFKENFFSNVVCINFLHHIQDISRVLLEIDRVLSYNGKIILADFNEKGSNIIKSVHQNEGKEHAYPVADKKEIKSYLEESGYKVKVYDSDYHWVIVGIRKDKKIRGKGGRGNAVQS